MAPLDLRQVLQKVFSAGVTHEVTLRGKVNMPSVNNSEKDLEKRYEWMSFLYSQLKSELEELQNRGLALKKEISQVVDQEKMSAILTKLKNNR